MIRVLVVDDHPVLRAGLEAVMRAEPGFACVGVAADGVAAVGVALGVAAVAADGRAAFGVAALCVSCAASEVRAEDASPWQRDAHSAVRLLAGSRSGPVLLGGVAIQLQPGWKTYWRTPGDSGVPPRFDFSKSDNVEAVTVLWPAPKKFDDGAGGTALGYKQQVVLPLRIVAKNADKPVTLRLDVPDWPGHRASVYFQAESERLRPKADSFVGRTLQAS